MPWKSEKQRKFMWGIASGNIKNKDISKKEASKIAHEFEAKKQLERKKRAKK